MKSSTRNKLFFGTSAAALVLGLSMTPAQAAPAGAETWTGGSSYYYSCDNPPSDTCGATGDNSWFNDLNWDWATPTGADTVNIDWETSFGPVDHNIVSVAGVQAATAGYLNVGAQMNGVGSLLVGNGVIDSGHLAVVHSVSIGQAVNSTGSVTIDGSSSLSTGENLIVGDQGTGTLDVTGTTETDGKVILGNQSGSDGRVTVTGTMTNNGPLTVGENGNGHLTVNAGGSVETSGQVVIANHGTSTSDVTVLGNMTNNSTLTVGGDGNAALNILAGGTVTTAGDVVIADRGSSTSAVNIVGGAMINNGALTVGEDGDAQLNIVSGGTATTSGSTVIADRSSSSSSVSVVSSTMNNGGNLIVGENGDGVLQILAGSSVNNDIGIIADRRGSESTASVYGAGSTWDNRDELVVGYEGNGTLILSADGAASVDGGAGTVRLGANRFSEGTINIGGDSATADAAAAGYLNAATVEFGQGTGTVNFNHTNSDYQFDAAFVGKGTINQIAGETVLNADSNNFTGTTNVNGGDLVINGTLASDINVSDAGTLRIGYSNVDTNDSGETGTILGNVANDGLVIFDRANEYTYGGVVSGDGAVWQRAAGTTILTGENTYSGGTLVTGGTLQLGNGGTTGSITGNVAIGRASTLAFDRSDDVIFDGRIYGRGGIVQAGTGKTTITGNNGNSFRGDTSITAGTLQLGDGATSGWLGGDIDVGEQGELVFDRTDTNSFRGDLTGSGHIVQAGAGKTILTDNSRDFTGTTTVAAGTLQLGNGGSRGWLSGDVQIDEAGRLVFDRSNGDTFTGVISGSGNIVQAGGGDAVLTGDSDAFAGLTTISAGSMVLGDGGTTGWLGGNVVNDSILGFNRSDTKTFSGEISGTGVVMQGGPGRTILTGANTYEGGTFVTQGVLQVGDGASSGSIIGDATVVGSGELAFNRSDEVTFAGVISGDGTLAQIGMGNTVLTGDSHAFTGASRVEAGTLTVNGQLGGTVAVLDGASLQGVGTVGSTSVLTGGTIAPGGTNPEQPIQTLGVSGNLDQAAGSFYQAQLTSTGEHDLLNVAGSVNLADGAVLNVTKLDSGHYDLEHRYTVLTAAGGITGAYTLTGDTAVSTFYQLQVHDNHSEDALANAVFVDVTQHRLFQAAGATANQIAAATAAQSLKKVNEDGSFDVSNRLFRSIAYLQNDQEAQAAFNQISGEIHVSARTALIEDSRYVRDATLNRLRVAFDGVAGSADGATNRTTSGGLALWGQGYGSWGHVDGDGNAASAKRSIGGFVMGVDAAVGEDVRVGVIGGWSKSDFDARQRSSTSTSDNYQLGLYAGGQTGNLGIRAGATYTWHKLDIDRSVSIGGLEAYSDGLSSKYDGHSVQAFGELGYRIDTAGVSFEPFAGLAYVDVKTDGFVERATGGGEAALTGSSESDSVTYGTLGLRASVNAGGGIVARGTLGWRHAFDDVVPNSTFRFAGSDSFTISGTPIARDAALIELGLDAPVASNINLGLSYSGQLGDGVQDHGVRANATFKF